MSPLEIDLDHVILGVADLAHGVEQFAARTGVVPHAGGTHPGRGTQNALVSLGPGRYLEILAATDPKAAASNPRVNYAELSVSGWALRTPDIQGVIDQLRAAGLPAEGPLPGSRRTPDGTLLQWTTAVARGPDLELAPFFIEWSADTVHPSASSPSGCTLVSLAIEPPETTRLAALFAAVGFRATLGSGTSPAIRMVLDCPKGRVTFR